MTRLAIFVTLLVVSQLAAAVPTPIIAKAFPKHAAPGQRVVKHADGSVTIQSDEARLAEFNRKLAKVQAMEDATTHVVKTTEEKGTHVASSAFHNPPKAFTTLDADDHVDARAYRDLLANNARTVAGLLRLYNTAMIDQCPQYLNALRDNQTLLQQLIAPIVTPTAQGRIHPLGYFGDPVSMIEYFMLACFGTSAVVKETFTVMTVWNDTVFFNIDFCLRPPPFNQSFCNNLTHVGFARVDTQGRVRSLKVLFQRLGINDLVLPPLGNAQQQAITTATQAGTQQGICGLVQARCTGSNQQYNSATDCNNYYNTIPWGGLERADQQDLGCVGIHIILTQSRPEIHCPHVGPHGGSDFAGFPCIQHSTQTFYDSDDVIYGL